MHRESRYPFILVFYSFHTKFFNIFFLLKPFQKSVLEFSWMKFYGKHLTYKRFKINIIRTFVHRVKTTKAAMSLRLESILLISKL